MNLQEKIVALIVAAAAGFATYVAIHPGHEVEIARAETRYPEWAAAEDVTERFLVQVSASPDNVTIWIWDRKTGSILSNTALPPTSETERRMAMGWDFRPWGQVLRELRTPRPADATRPANSESELSK